MTRLDAIKARLAAAGSSPWTRAEYEAYVRLIKDATADLALLVKVAECARDFKDDDRGIMGPHLGRMLDDLAPLLEEDKS